MENKDLLAMTDHTKLGQDCVWADISALCDEAIKHGTASVCIPPSFVKQASDYVEGKLAICTVIGFPNGYSTTACKMFETKDAITNGAKEIDMVANIGDIKNGEFDKVLEEIKAIKFACGDVILKVIIETCLLSEAEKIKMCEVVTASGADFIKTSTGFSTGGATPEDIELFAKHIGPDVRIKAAGGISTLEDARTFAKLGAKRLGSSKMVSLATSGDGGSGY